MTPKQVEYVAQAFYEAEYPSAWHEAPEHVQEHYRVLAQRAIIIIREQVADGSVDAIAFA